MAIQVQGNGGVVAEVDGTTFRAIRVTARPINYGSLGMYKASDISGTMAVSLGATSEIMQWRWADGTNLGLVYRVSMSAGGNVAATTAVLLGFNLIPARSWTVAGSGGTRITLTTPNGKLRASMGASLVNDMGVSTTAALTVGTKTLDSTAIGSVACAVGTAAITTTMDLSWLKDADGCLYEAAREGGHPFVAAQNEGLVVRTDANAFPAGMTWHFGMNVTWAEASAF